MTDKQNIIDGVDVSGCECYSVHREGYCGWHTPCEGDICPYKLKWALQQLTAKEQKLKNIEEFRHNYCMNCEDLLKPTHSCCGCNMSILRHLIEEQI